MGSVGSGIHIKLNTAVDGGSGSSSSSGRGSNELPRAAQAYEFKAIGEYFAFFGRHGARVEAVKQAGRGVVNRFDSGQVWLQLRPDQWIQAQVCWFAVKFVDAAVALTGER